jgi:restriction system protein
MMPSQAELEIPLLEVLQALGGQARAEDIYPRLSERFPKLTEDDLASTLKHGQRKWQNRIQWTRQSLVTAGDMASPQRGIWAITEQGKTRLKATSRDQSDLLKQAALPRVSLVELYETYDVQFRAKLLDKLFQLTPRQFELFARELLTAYGFVKVVVTQTAKDGGIDGHGLLRVGLARMAVAFQCKRWDGNVPRTEVDKFRGAIQGEYEQGIFFTTSDFTKAATEASIKKGVVPIVLLNGESIVDLMIEKEFAVQKRPLQIYEDQLETLLTDPDTL